MPNVLIRDVPETDLAELKAAAARQNVSLQTYLIDTVRGQVQYVRRKAALERAAQRLAASAPVTADERQAVLDAIEAAHDRRSHDVAR